MKVLVAILAALVLLATPASAGQIPQMDGWRVIDTKMSYATLVEHLDAAVKANKMGLVNAASASDGAKAQGVVIPGNRVVGVFRNDFARRMLKASLIAGIEAPLRYYLVENPDGTATLSYKKPSAVFVPYVSTAEPDLAVLAAELDVIFAKIAEEATASK